MEEKRTKEAPKSLLDYNASWPLTLVFLGFLMGIYFAQQYSMQSITSDLSPFVFFLVAVVGGVLFSFFFYNLGKIVFASISGYRVVLIRILGLTIDKSGSKAKVNYDITRFFTLKLQFAPKDDDLTRNPKLFFFGGLIFEAFLLIAAIFFLFAFCINHERSLIGNFGWTFLYAVCYGFLTPLYELIPLRQDYPTDMYNIMMIHDKEDQKAFNLYLVNLRRELTGEDFLVPSFENYDSFYKLHTLYYLYLQDLYESKLEKAFAVLEDMKYYSKYYLDDEKYLPFAESVYLKFLINDNEGARKLFSDPRSIKRDSRRLVTNPDTLTGYRIAILVLAVIYSDKENVVARLKEFDTMIKGYGEPLSSRVNKEIRMFDLAYNNAKKINADINLPERS